jgi:hypothetical protein
VLVIGWLGLRPGDQAPAPVQVASDLRSGGPVPRVDAERAPLPPAGAPSRVDEILALNEKAVSAYSQADVKTARTLLQDADRLAIASGYKDAPVRAQTQVRLGALFIGQKSARAGRRHLLTAVAINPAVRVPPPMMTPQVQKTLFALKRKARLAKNGGPKGGLKSHPSRRHGRDLKRQG